MFQQVAFAPLFGIPLVAWLGMATLISIFLTASIAILNKCGIHTTPFRWHPRCAAIALVLAAIHGSLAVLIYL